MAKIMIHFLLVNLHLLSHIHILFFNGIRRHSIYDIKWGNFRAVNSREFAPLFSYVLLDFVVFSTSDIFEIAVPTSSFVFRLLSS